MHIKEEVEIDVKLESLWEQKPEKKGEDETGLGIDEVKVNWLTK